MKRSIAPSTNLVLSLRDMGYTLETALADVIDNSISSGATRITIMSPPTSPPRITITDNGKGLTEEQIQDALTLARLSPDVVRLSDDLGRYGMGMKTASWSQCRRLTLVSAVDGDVHGATVDLDDIHASNEWVADFLEPSRIAELPDIATLPQTGTMLVWEALDRVVAESDDHALTELASKLGQAAAHLELVFHRFLTHEAGHPQIVITLNKRDLEPTDPFASRHPATQRSSEETIRLGDSGDVTIQAFTLPHHSKISAEASERLGGAEGYVKNQGFYLYRERRLILWGTWFRLTRAHPTLNLSRIRIDIPNTMDAQWHINIIKASAQPPRVVRDRLKQIIDSFVAPSRRIYRHRGYTQTQDEYAPVWMQKTAAGRVSYQIVDSHPLIARFRDGLTREQKDTFRAVLETVQSSVPMDALTLALADGADKVDTGAISAESLRVLFLAIVPMLLQTKKETDVWEQLRRKEPFRSNLDQLDGLITDWSQHERD